MATIKFYLKEPNSTRETLIYVKYYSENLKVKLSSGQKITPNNWNQNTQKARRTYSGYPEMNSFLASAKAELGRIERETLANKVKLSSDLFKKEFSKFIGTEIIEKQFSVIEALEEFMIVKKEKLSYNYLRSVTTLKNHLINFSRDSRFKLTFENINLSFFEKFTSYLLMKGQTNNTIGTNVSRLKYFLNWATKMGYNNTLTYKDKDFKVSEKPTEEISLTEEELFTIYDLDLSENKRLSNVRDFFCFGCFTGLRYSDIEKLKPEDITGDEINITIHKTREVLNIPLNQFAREILERNNFTLPVISNQKTNDYLKEIGELAGINDTVKTIRYRGAKREETLEKKFNLISSHTGRRTFITLSLEKGMRPEVVMKISGHKSMKYFMRYVKITDKIKKIELQRVWNRNSEPMLQAV